MHIHNQKPEALLKLYNTRAFLYHRPLQNIKTEYIYSNQLAPLQKRALVTVFKAWHLHLPLSDRTCTLLSDAISDRYGLCRRIHCQGDLGLTVFLHNQLFHAFHLRGEMRFQLPPPISINYFLWDQDEA
jgi:hypothetical protein